MNRKLQPAATRSRKNLPARSGPANILVPLAPIASRALVYVRNRTGETNSELLDRLLRKEAASLRRG
jgi:hypothetical protein